MSAAVSVSLLARGRAAAIFDHGQESFRITTTDTSVQVYTASDGALKTLGVANVRGLCHTDVDGTLLLAIMRFNQGAAWQTTSFVYNFNAATAVFEPLATVATHGGSGCTFFKGPTSGTTFLAVANFNNNGRETSINSFVYRLTGSSFELFATLPTRGAVDVTALESDVVNGVLLVFANSYDTDTLSYETESSIWQLSSEIAGFALFQSIAVPSAQSVAVVHPADGGPPMLVFASLRTDAGVSNVYCPVLRYNSALRTFTEVQRLSALDTGFRGAATVRTSNTNVLLLAAFGDNDNAIAATSSPIYVFDAKSQLWQLSSAIAGTAAVAAAAGSFRGATKLGIMVDNSLVSLSSPAALFVDLTTLSADGDARFVSAGAPPSFLAMDSTFARVELAAGQTSATLIVREDALDETNEAIALTLFSADGDVLDTAILTIQDNDITIFTARDFLLSIRENEPIGTQAAPTATTRALQPAEAFSFELVNFPDGQFAIDKSTGVITTAAVLDREAQGVIVGSIIATSSQFPGATDTATITIMVGDENDNAPQFGASALTLFLAEGVRIGTVVTTLVAVDADAGGLRQYTMTPFSALFSLNVSSGAITTVQEFELDGASADASSYTFDVTVSDGLFSDVAELRIIITDDNDNFPTFSSTSETIMRAEDLAPGSLITTFTAIDADSSLANSLVTYRIKSGNTAPVTISSSTGRLTLSGPLDYETVKSYNFTIIATDSSIVSPLSGSLEVIFHVSNVNDAGPSFEGESTTVFISESLDTSTAVVTMAAADPDGSPEGTRYTVDSSLVQIDANGAVTLTQMVNREALSSFAFVVTATDEDNGLFDTFSVVVIVLDENDNRPVWVENPSAVTLAEDTPVGTTVASFRATDADQGENGRVSFTINPTLSVGADLFKIDENTGVVTLVGDPDFETEPVLSLRIVALDNGSPSLRRATQLTITLTDVNDEPPQAASLSRSVTIAENAATGDNIVDLEVSDADVSPSFSNLTFSIAPDEGLFRVDKDGVVVLAGELDREDSTSHTFTVTVSDGVTSININVFVTVSDVNDNSPSFVGGRSSLTVSESASVGLILETYTLSDDDEAGAEGITLTAISTPANIVTIGAGNTLRLAASLDYESNTAISIELTASDGKFQTTRSVSIDILNVNEFRPVFSSSGYTVTLIEGVVGALITVSATDNDAGDAGDIRFSLAPSASSNRFAIDAITGAISATFPFDAEATTRVDLTVLAIDQDPNSPSSSSVTLRVNIADINDEPPIFRPDRYATTVAESASVGLVIVQTTATDADATSTNQAVTYAIVAGDPENNFEITSTGVIKVRKTLDFGSGDIQRQLNITATNTASPGLQGVASVDVTINPSNEFAPAFSPKGSLAVIASEGLAVNALVPGAVFEVMDADAGVDGEVDFSIIGDGPFKLSVAGARGAYSVSLQIATSLDREDRDTYTVIVEANDRSAFSLMSRAIFNVTVADEDDNAPQFMPESYAAILEENVAIGTQVLRVYAVDRDIAPNNAFTFVLSDPDVPFAINESTGVVSVREIIDFEELSVKFFVLSVLARPTRGDDVSAQATIEIQDVNDNRPVIRNVEVITVKEGVEPRSLLATFTATDADAGINARVRFRILEGNDGDDLSLDTSGALFSAKALDYERTRQYRLIVEAHDLGTPSLETNFSVTIAVEDENDNHPEFSEPDGYTFTVIENLGVGVALNATATGPIAASDADNNGDDSFLRFNFAADTAIPFALDALSGRLTTAARLDHEAQKVYTFNIRVIDQPSDSRVKEVAVRVEVIDVNDNDPYFAPVPPATAVIEENAANGAVVASFTAVDPDSAGNLTYIVAQVTPSSGALLFEMDQLGNLLVASSLDFESNAAYIITVRTIDAGVPARSVETTLALTLTDVNDNAPQFDKTAYVLTLDEEIAVGTNLLEMNVTDLDSSRNGELRVALVSSPAALAFGIMFDATSGVATILSAARLDAEITASYVIQVRATDGADSALSATASVTINLRDVNDNSPTFTLPFYSGSVLENAPAGQEVVVVSATDDDKGDNSIVSYSLLSWANIFSIDPASGVLTTRAPLDRESQPSGFVVLIQAVDGGQPANVATVNVSVTIRDEADSAPIFAESRYTFTVEENRASGSAVGTVFAEAQDIVVAQNVTYTLQGGDVAQFKVDKTSGLITTTASFDREARATYQLAVLATTDGPKPLSSTVIVDVSVFDLNDNAPVIVSQPQASPLVAETQPAGFVVFSVSAADVDAGINADITYTIDSGNSDGAFVIDANTGQVSVGAVRLDYERRQAYLLAIKAADGGNPSKSTVVTVVVYVLDTNDEPPVFASSFNQVRPVEHTAAGQRVATISATDRDLNVANSRVTYALIGGVGANLFTLDASTGVMRTAAPLDREVTSSYTLTVRATDAGTPPLVETTPVIVAVADINDNQPQPPPGLNTALSVVESAAVDEEVAQIVFTDDDTGINAQLSYTLSGTGSSDFAVSSAGMITVARKLDRETRASYNFRLTVQDLGDPSLRNAVDLTVAVLDANDNKPRLSGPSSAAILESAVIDTVVATYTATDADATTNAIVAFLLSSDTTGGAFRIGAFTGQVQVSATLDYETQNEYVLEITAYNPLDPSGPNGTASLSVFIGDVNDNSPQLRHAAYNVTIAEEEPETVLLTLQATDADAALNTNFAFAFIGSVPSAFKLDATTGILSTTRPLDFETDPTSFTFQVRVSDGHGPARFSDASTVTVTVEDINDNAPAFKAGNIQLDVSENEPAGVSLGAVTATDPDSGLAGAVTYALSGVDAAQFRINSATGTLTTAATFDREVKSSYSLVVTATNIGSPQLSSQASVIVSILDVNDQAPTLSSSSGSQRSFTFSEDVPIGTPVATLISMDGDTGNNGLPVFDLISGGGGVFAVGRTSGIVAVSSSLDYESTASYRLVIIVRDNTTASGTGDAQPIQSIEFAITVTDVNDNAPAFLEKMYQTTVNEAEPDGTALSSIFIEAIDVDEDGAQPFFYSIEGDGSEDFSIDAVSGQLTLAAPLDRETRAVYNLFVTATDNDAQEPLTGSVPLIITVADDNDNAPIFTVTPRFEFTVPESTPALIVFGMVEATDADVGLNGIITYSLTGGSRARFSINVTSGELSLRSGVDREVQDNYFLIVQAADSGQPQRLVEQRAVIQIGDVDDNAPILSPSSKTLSLGELTAVGTPLVSFTATDADLAENAAVAFRLASESSETSGLFGINASGTLFLAEPFDLTVATRHALVVEAYNPNNVAGETDMAEVTIDVFDENNNAPEFRGSLTFDVSESAAQGSAVGMLQATDADEGFNAEINFAWAEPAAATAFDLDSITGSITVRSTLDREVVATYTLNVTASDRGALSRTTSTLVTINVLDINDNLPVFTPRVYVAEVAEDAAIGTELVRLSFSDADGLDQPAADKLSLRIVDNFEGQFLLDKEGILRLNASLDRESTPSYTVTIAIEDSAQQAGISASVLITVGDVNDNAPEFESAVFRVAISENVNPALPRNFVATDPDAGKNGVIKYSLDANAFGFSVNAFGFVQSSRPLNFETTPSLNLTIRASDNGTDPQTTSALIVVTVADANDNEPIFQTPLVLTNISETAPVGAEVGVVQADDVDVGDRLSYSFQVPSALFAINEVTGVITVRNPLDFEKAESHTLLVRVSDGSNFASTTVIVSVFDENDNVPVFRLPKYEATLVETLQVDNVIVSLSATDDDAGLNGQITYTLANTSQSDKFRLDSTSGELTVSEPLDREEGSVVVLTALARDGGGRSTSVSITIRVLDLNDNAPRFVSETIQIFVPENAPVGTLVDVVAAEDKDEGDNAAATYTIAGDDVGNFSVDAATGAIVTKSIFDRESRDTYRFTITARDAGFLSSLFFDSAEVTVSITDVNDHAPIISPSTTDRLLLREDVAVGLVLAEYSATDTDVGVNGNLLYTLQLVEAFDAEGRAVIPNTLPFAVGETSGVVIVDAPLDRETVAFFLLNVIVGDHSDAPLNATARMEIEVTDVNDSPPRFNVTRVDVSRSERTALGDIVYRAQAVDADLGQNAVVFYSIVAGNDNGTFAISASLGTITLVKELDREAEDEHSLTIQAADGGDLSTTLLLVVTVTDVNDNDPRFEGTAIRTLTVSENAMDPVSLTFTATDVDVGANANLSFTLTGPVASAFEVARTSSNGVGEVRLIAPLDREETGSTTNLTVVATDGGAPTRSGTLLIIVTVLDVNDNRPTFGQEPFRISFRENIASGVIAVLSVDDADVDVNGDVRIDISPPADGFAVDPSTFELTLFRSFDFEVEKEFVFNVTATDLGSPPRSAHTMLIVNVLDTNDNAPVFDALSFSTSVAEDEAIGTVVLTVSASDIDSGNNARLEYYIVRVGGVASDGAELPLELDPTSGNITIRAPLDYETDQNFDLTILVKDSPSNGAGLNDTVEVSIQISDVNDNAPRFLQDIFKGTASEDTQAGAKVVTIVADDPDLGAGGVVRYSFLSTYSEFVLDSVTGVITVSFTADFDREVTPFYTLEVQATDLASPPRVQNGTVYVAIGDINDNPPMFPSASITTTVSEGVPKNTPFFTIQASDADIGDNAFLTYTLDSVSPTGAVTVNATTGGLLNVNLDYETNREVRAVLRATNTRASPGFSSSITINMIVTDANDVAPIFNPASYEGSVTEDDTAGRVLAVATATDPDTGLGGTISYGLRAANGQDVSSLFVINAVSGIVATKQSLDRELAATYDLLIVARDLGSPPLESTASLLVTVLDINDNNPFFDNVTYEATLSEASTPGTVVITVKATDPDAPSNPDLSYAILLPGTVPFVIDATTGVIASAGIFDREGQDLYTFAVTASDGGEKPRTATVQVTITITDVNDKLPQLRNVGSRFSVSEGAADGTSVGAITASDEDIGDNAIVTYRLVSVTPNPRNMTLLSIDRDTGVLRVAGGLDRETAPLLQVTVEAQNTLANPTLAPVRGVYTVALTDANDNAPVFDADLPTTVQVREDAATDTLVALLSASDDDLELNGKFSFALVDNFDGTFDVGASSGRVTLIKRLDREMAPSYTLMALATDAGDPALVSRPFNFTVVVTDVNDEVPTFLAPVYSATVPENEIINATLVTVMATDPDQTGSRLRYVLAMTSLLFRMESFSGSLKLIGALDREIVSRHTLSVLVIDEDGRNSTATIVIAVSDSNDNGPVFIGAPYTVQVEENLRGVEIFVPQVEDADGGANAALTFSLDNVADSSRYAIDEQTGRIVLLQAFDFETTKSTTVRIRAADQGNDPQSTATDITVIVLDVNDNVPELLDNDIKVVISEDAGQGAFVARLEGRDVDTPGASPLSFALLAQDVPFTIDVATGMVTVSGRLDRETKDIYVIPTIVSDGALSSRGKLTVIVSDVNDNPPLFSADTPRRLRVEESAAQDTALVTLEASDADVNNNFTFRLANSTAAPGTFAIDPETGELRLSGALDFEVVQVIYLQVVVEDDNQGRRRRRDDSATGDIAHLLSRGRRSACVERPLAECFGNCTIDEGTGTCRDASCREIFDVQSCVNTRGCIFEFNVCQDSSQRSTTTATSTATMTQMPPLLNNPAATTTVTLLSTSPASTVINPLATNLTGGFSTMRSTTAIATTTTTTPTTSTMATSIASTTAPSTTTSSTTTTTSTTTSTTSATIIDPETIFDIGNAGCARFCDVRVIVIHVTDVNDNVPVFTQNAYQVDIDEDKAIDSVIATVSALDDDAGSNAIVSYRLLSNEGRFGINAATGAVRLTAGLNFEATQIYQLQIEAADGGVPSKTAVVPLTINVFDVNDSPPRFEISNRSIEVPENTAEGTVLTFIAAEDEDSGINSEIRYALADNANVPFAVDSATGALTLAGALDREATVAYLFNVVASDLGSPSLSSTLTVAVTVTDVNDNKPIFVGAPYSASIDENLETVMAVLTVSATDADVGSAGAVRYSLTGPQASKFYIQPTTGVIVAEPSLNFEETPSFVLTVVATDQASPFNSAETDLFITVNDVNDNAPAFSSTTYNRPVLESVPIGSTVLRATASDVDTGAVITYSITDLSGTFAMNSSTGEVTTTKRLDRESIAQYAVGLVVQDEGGRVGRATLTVPVLDVNDEAPVFVLGAFSGTVTENSASVTQVVRVEAVDADLGDNSRITYAFVDPPPNNFVIDAITGVVTAVDAFNREEQDTFVFAVVASDGGSPKLVSAAVPVTVTVTDVNDNTPMFDASPTLGSNFISVGAQGIPEYTIILTDATCTAPNELCDVGSPVLRLRASDADLGANAALTYHLLTATSDFAIETATGDLLLGRPIDREQQESFSLTVEVRDGASGQAMRSARATVTLSIGDLNDNAPVFDSAMLSAFTVSESAARGTLLTTVVARDADAGSNAVVRYSLRRNDGSFANADGRVTLDFASGELRVFAFDFEAESSFDLIIVAADSGISSQATETALTVRVTDVNDMAPRLSSETPAQVITVSEVISDGVGIFGFVGEDADGTVINSDMAYALSDAPRIGWFSLDSHSDGSVTGSGSPRVVVGNNLRFRTGLANIFNITVSARNPLASTGRELRDAISRQVEIVPFLGSTTPPDATVQTFNFQMPDVCADYPAADFCQIGTRRRRRRRAISSNHHEIWMRRGFDCNALACQGYDAEIVVNGVCVCRIYGPERGELEATVGYTQELQQYTYPGLRADTAYEFQLRIYDESFELVRLSEYYGLRTVNFNVGSPMVTQISGNPSFNVTWSEPSTPNGRLVGYRVCYCPPSVQPVLCTCRHSKASAVPSSGLTRRHHVIVPEVSGALRPGINYTFVVEVETTLEDASISLTYSDPVGTPDPAIYDAGSSGSSSNMVGSGSIAGIILGFVVLLLLLALLVLVSRRKRSRSGRSNMSVKPMGKDMNGNDMELEPVKRSMLQDSMGSGLDMAGSGTAGDDNGGYWDYFVKERANQFWPEGLQSESFTEAPVMESVLYDGEPHDTAARTRQFGLNTVRVMADGFGGMQVGTGDMAWETASGRHAGASGGAPGAAMGAASTGAKSGASRELELKFLGQLEGSTTIKATVLEERVSELRAKGTIDAEFAKIKQDSAASDLTFHTAMETYNVRKNRYGNVLPIDATRVLLSHSGVLGSDYINANYLPGFRRPSAFVATQAPVPNTIPDFWRMVWEQQAGVIVMITREVEMGKIKCHKYWPDASATISVGELEVTFVSYDGVCEDYGIRKLLLCNPGSGEVREITQFVYQTWPDHGVPTSPAALIRYILDVRRHVEAARAQGSGSGPAIVHCSAGIGRTGTFFAVNALMQRLDALGTVDVMSTVAYLRTYRAGSVQTLDQYRYIYDALLTYYRSNPSIHHLASSVQQGSRAAAASALPGSYAGNQMFSSEYGTGEVPNYDQEVFAMGQDATLNTAEDPEYLIRALNRL